MSFRPALYMLLSAVLLTTVMTSVSSAQWLGSRQTSLRPLRFLGQGWGSGYHHRNPGPNVDYYNPYNAHNSSLVSQGGMMAGSYGGYQSYSMDGGSTPFSSYAPSSTMNSSNFNSLPGGSLQPTFQESTPVRPASPAEAQPSAATSSEANSSDTGTKVIESGDDSALSWPRSSFDGSNDFQPASFSKPATESSSSAADWSIEDPFDMSNNK